MHMISRRSFIGRLVAAAVAAKLALSGGASAKAAAQATPAGVDTRVPEYLRCVYLEYQHAKGDNPRRYMLNRELVSVGLDLRSGGVTTGQVQRMMREARLQANRDFGTAADPWAVVRGEPGFAES